MKKERMMQLKYGAWGFVVGAVVASLLGFTWGGWVTSGRAHQMTADAVLANQTSICVAQFMDAPGHSQNLKEFRAIDSWKRSDFVNKGGWDKMPGEATAQGPVSSACADGIDLVATK
jgi:hypothetical protein